ncbi:hypothetical protein AMELA_G00197980 [Ameiurus melas]|uniref:Uncharacterized protein n=1 Tax=Ameiurus melas TaxID=219545 RepID=A0A7J6AA56_AMEME|nr:hypothetical protein AMELA_G00197980 [Ameiurus melas]
MMSGDKVQRIRLANPRVSEPAYFSHFRLCVNCVSVPALSVIQCEPGAAPHHVQISTGGIGPEAVQSGTSVTHP